MNPNKKVTLLVLLLILAGSGIALIIYSLVSKDGGNAPEASATPAISGTQTGEADKDADNADDDQPKPTAPLADYEDEAPVFTEDMPELVFSANGSFYTENLTLKIYTRDAASIYYTMDGTVPTESSLTYKPENGLYLTSTQGSIPKVYNIRALAVYEDGSRSAVFSHSYFLGAKVSERYQTLIVNVTGDPADLTSGPNGIFYGNNYELRGQESERPVHVDLLRADGTLVSSQDLGVRIYGAYSRMNSQKSMKFFARRSYSPDTGTYLLTGLDCFRKDGTGSQIVRFDKFVLRASGNDYRFAFIRDELNQTLAIDAGMDNYETVAPCIAYVNGSYFGFYWLHAAYCDKYFKDLYGDSPAKQAAGEEDSYEEGSFVMLEGGDTFKNADEEDEEQAALALEYQTAYERFVWSDVTNDSVYSELCEWMDVDNYLRYMAYNIYLCNKDWPHNNYKCFRYVPADGEATGEGAYDGRWRYLLHDADYTLGLYDQQEVLASYDTLHQILLPSSDRYSPLLAALLMREDCRKTFVLYSLDLGNGALSAKNVESILNAMSAERSQEMSYYYNYLLSLRAEDVSWINESQLAGNLQVIKDFANARPARSLAFLKTQFALSDSYQLKIAGCDNARLQVNSYLAKAGAAFSGTYVTDYETTVSAQYQYGYAFDYWEVNEEKRTDETLVLHAEDVKDGKIHVVLHVKAASVPVIRIDSISSTDQDYVILKNTGNSEISLAGMTLQDDNYKFTIPEGTVLAAGETYTMYCNNCESILPEGAAAAVFNLSTGETVTLCDTDGTVIDAILLPKLHSGYLYCRDWFSLQFTEQAAN